MFSWCNSSKEALLLNLVGTLDLLTLIKVLIKSLISESDNDVVSFTNSLNSNSSEVFKIRSIEIPSPYFDFLIILKICSASFDPSSSERFLEPFTKEFFKNLIRLGSPINSVYSCNFDNIHFLGK